MNPAISAVPGSLIRALHARRRPSSINLGIGEPTLLPNVTHFETAAAWVGVHGCRYSPNVGDLDLREAIAEHYGYPGLDGAANVCITNGSQEAVYLALRTLLDPARDELLVVEPSFPVYAKIAQVEGIPLRRVTFDPLAPDAFDAGVILAAIGPRTRAIVICSPCNPTGRVASHASARRLVDGLQARGGEPLFIVHDEIYRELVYTDDAADFAKIYPYTIAINSLSKSNSLTGLRIGWAIGPADVMPDFVKMHGWTTSCASTFAQRVAVEIFAAEELDVQRPWYARQRDAIVAHVRASGLPFVEPDGAFYVCVRVAADGSLAFAEELLETRDVIAIPGDLFGESMRGWLRTSFVGPLDEVREGLDRIASLAAERSALVAR